MKQLPLLLIVVVLISSCKKDNELKEFKSKIVGIWEYEKTLSFEIPFNPPPLQPGNGRIIVIGEDGTFERKKHDTLVFRGSYTLQRKDDCYPRTDNVIFQTNENTAGEVNYIGVENDKLTMATPNCWADGGVIYYRRIR